MGQLVLIVQSTDHVDKAFRRYKTSIMFGLLLSMAGDAMLVWRVSLFIPGLLFFALAHLFYIRAFGFKPYGGGPTAVSCLILLAITFLTVAPVLEDKPVMYLLVLLYCCVIFTMAWRSIVCLQTLPGIGSFCACAGAVLFVASDFIIAYDKFSHTIDGAPLYVNTTYFMAQMMIALSAACYDNPAPTNKHK
jgi:uncharacterized membrane protein YhhN